MLFVDYVRAYHAEQEYENLELAINLAIDRCIMENVLRNFLKEHRSEVVKVTQLDYTFDRQIELEREDAKREGIGQGEVIKLITLTCKKKRKGIPPREAAEMLEEDETVVYRIYQIADECATDSDVDAIYKNYCGVECKSDS